MDELTPNDQVILKMLKFDIGILTTAKDEYLAFLLQSAKKNIESTGIILEEVVDDNNLVVMYAAYLFRKRASETDNPMPQMLKYMLHNRLFKEKMKT